MAHCTDCHVYTYTHYAKYGNIPLCAECAAKRNQAEIEEKSKSLQKASDLAAWSHSDMSELFWMHLGRYIKSPNEHSLHMMIMAKRWANHDNHGLANSFEHALKWAKIDLYAEEEKWAERRRKNGENKS